MLVRVMKWKLEYARKCLVMVFPKAAQKEMLGRVLKWKLADARKRLVAFFPEAMKEKC